jgi:hypothetical protein
MPAYRGGYLLKNPFLGTRTLQRAKAGFQGAKEMQDRQEALYKGALESGANRRSSYLQKIMPKHLAEKAAAEEKIGTHGYARAHQTLQSEAAVGRSRGKIKKYQKEGDKRKVKKIKQRDEAAIAASREAEAMHSRVIGSEKYKLGLAADTRNLFFSGQEFAREADTPTHAEWSKRAMDELRPGFGGKPVEALGRFRRQDPEGFESWAQSRGRMEEAFAPGKSRMWGHKRFGRRRMMRRGESPLQYATSGEELFKRGTSFAEQYKAEDSGLYRRPEGSTAGYNKPFLRRAVGRY